MRSISTLRDRSISARPPTAAKATSWSSSSVPQRKSTEAFLDAAANSDNTDRRCLTQDQNRVAIDVRFVPALPDYQTPAGQKDLETLFLLGNPTSKRDSARVSWLSAQSVYEPQAQLQIRGRNRQVCARFKKLQRSLPSLRGTGFGQPERADRQRRGQGSPRPRCAASPRRVQVSNMKPDDTVIRARLAQKNLDR
jgi:hypothetical protein